MLFDASGLLLPAQLMATAVLLVSPVNVYCGAPVDGMGTSVLTLSGSSGNRCPGHC